MEIIAIIATILIIFIFLALYFLPAYIAFKRDHKNKGAILAMNILLGWTFLGWAIAAIWAFTDNTK